MNFFFTNVAYAAGESLDKFIQNVNNLIINPLIVLLFALALAYFLWGVFVFISNQDNEEKKTTGKSHMVYGLIGITIMMGVWTILSIVMNTLNISTTEINPSTGKVDLGNYNPPAGSGELKIN
ncbi:MAG: hypothetical protein WAV23_01755 [Minisyncoccia bacterium]